MADAFAIATIQTIQQFSIHFFELFPIRDWRLFLYVCKFFSPSHILLFYLFIQRFFLLCSLVERFMLITPPRHHLVIYMLLYLHLLRLFSSLLNRLAIADFDCCRTTYSAIHITDPDSINTEIT